VKSCHQQAHTPWFVASEALYYPLAKADNADKAKPIAPLLEEKQLEICGRKSRQANILDACYTLESSSSPAESPRLYIAVAMQWLTHIETFGCQVRRLS